MNPDIVASIQQIASVLGPALGAFLVGHFHLILKPKAPTTPGSPSGTPSSPSTPATPLPNLPGTTLPIGQGGILQFLGLAGASLAPATGQPVNAVGKGGLLQLAGLFIQSILAGPGTTKDKAAAAASIINATEPFTASAPVSKDVVA